MTLNQQAPKFWNTRRNEKARRIESVQAVAQGKVLPTNPVTVILETLIASGDRVVLEGNN